MYPKVGWGEFLYECVLYMRVQDRWGMQCVRFDSEKEEVRGGKKGEKRREQSFESGERVLRKLVKR